MTDQNNNDQNLPERDATTASAYGKKIVVSKSRLAVILAIVGTLAFGGYYLLQMLTEEDVMVEEERPLVEADKPSVQDMEERTTVIGNVDPTDTRIVVPELSSEVQQVYVEKGDQVDQGDILMELDDGDHQLQLQEARASADAARSKLQEAKAGARTGERAEAESNVNRARDAKEQMERELERVEALYEEGYVSDQELEQVQMQYQNANEQLKAAEGYLESVEEGAREDELNALRAQVDRANTGVQLANRMLDRTQITAPASGEVIMVDAEEGELVGSDSPAFALLDPDSYQVLAGLPESYVNQVAEGDTVEVVIPSAQEEPFQAMINYIGQVPPEEGGAGYPVEIDLQKEIEEKVRSGMYTRVNVTLNRSEQAVSVPQHAVVEEGDEMGVYTVAQTDEEQSVKFQPVETGITDKGYIEIISGLEPDQIVILEGFGEITDGSKVDIAEMGDNS